METEVVVNFDDIADAFIRANMSGSPAELHGLLCGRVSGGEHLSEEDLVSTVAEFLDVPPERVEDFGDMLPDLYQFTYGQICSSGFEFVPLLPDDDFSLNERLASLGEWCQGFLFGLGNIQVYLLKLNSRVILPMHWVIWLLFLTLALLMMIMKRKMTKSAIPNSLSM